jgi:hypothetical protein
MDQAKLLPLSQVARELRVPVKWLRDEALAGRVPHLRAGTQFLFDLEALTDVLAKRARSNGSAADREASHA